MHMDLVCVLKWVKSVLRCVLYVFHLSGLKGFVYFTASFAASGRLKFCGSRAGDVEQHDADSEFVRVSPEPLATAARRPQQRPLRGDLQKVAEPSESEFRQFFANFNSGKVMMITHVVIY